MFENFIKEIDAEILGTDLIGFLMDIKTIISEIEPTLKEKRREKNFLTHSIRQ